MNIPPMPKVPTDTLPTHKKVGKLLTPPISKSSVSTPKHKYRSYSHTLSNERGEEEVRIEYHNNWLRNLFHLETKKYVFVKAPYLRGWRWAHKYIGYFATKKDLLEILQIIEFVRQENLYKEEMDISGTLGN